MKKLIVELSDERLINFSFADISDGNWLWI